MISRRQLRIKALSVLYACNRKEISDLEEAEQELMLSVRKSYDLYHYLLLLLIALSDMAREKVVLSRAKNIPSPEDINPNTRFAENRVISQLRKNEQLHRYAEATPALWTRKDRITGFRSLSRWLGTRGLSWSEHPGIVRMIYNEMTQWESYRAYMSSPDDSYKADRSFIKELVTKLLPASGELAASLEEQSVYWNDDLFFVVSMIRNSVGKFRESDDGSSIAMPTLFTSEDDEKFVKILLRKAILNSEKNSALIDSHTTNWEVERIALMDQLVMHLAVTELVEFPEVPVKVTLNEYIEIAKDYCTAKSSTFVNGILDKIVREMRADGSFVKEGRGLIGEA
ncbi:MAG: transcription antitermination factor NusB [Bacteroidales bacterium]|jgi:N utilization substance protein B|nr:transcription antitermination factor NusB [Bacteroidales bacterium]